MNKNFLKMCNHELCDVYMYQYVFVLFMYVFKVKEQKI